MKKSTPTLPVFCLSTYPERNEREPFYMISLSELSKNVTDVDRPHSHSFYMVMLVLRGSGRHVVDLDEYAVDKNQMYFLRPGQVHSWELSDDIEGYCFFFESNFFNGQYSERINSLPIFQPQTESAMLEVTNNVEFSFLFEHAFNEYNSSQPARGQVVLSYLYIIVEKASRLYAHNYRQVSVSAGNILVHRYEQEINKNFLTRKNVKYYADILSVTPNHLNFVCKNLLNKTASQLIHERIGIEAQRLLAHSGATIKEVANALHFDDYSYFNRFFKKQFGISASEFKQVLW